MLTLADAAAQIRTRRLSPVELTQECLGRIERLDPTLNAFITVTADLALEQARRAESEIGAGNYRGPLHGIPIALKDLLDTAGVRTTAASNQYRERVPAEDAVVVCRLKDAGAVILGKLNMHEFAFGMTGVISAFGPTKNPWNKERAVRRRVRGQRLRRGCAWPLWARIHPAPSAVPPRCAALWDIVPAPT
jgi:aspartyl-tRNA(Asn)/glutamyl-tRNA(Gln) amidotransferase subunit A